jgi:membrane-bound lytic murein transglycosylase D
MRTRSFMVTFLTALSSTTYGSELSEPKCLSKNIDFWYDVYTKHDDQDGLILDADSQELVVLKKVRLPTDERKRKDIIKAIRIGYEKSNSKIRIITGIKSKFKQGLVRDSKYRSSVEAEIKKIGLPIEISALPHVESGYNPRARSKVGAVGLWQVMPATAKHLGFNPRHLLSPAYNTRVGLAVLVDAYTKLKSWPLAITAYNHGVNGVARAVRETGSTDVCTILSDYNGPRFGVSSRNFYASFLAVLRILRDEGVLDE